MPRIEHELIVRAPVERVFDLCLSIELHLESTSQTRERAIAGVTSGLIGLNQDVTWEARHLGVRQRLTSRITEFDRPRHFRDSMVSGPFRRFDHDHDFVTVTNGTLMRDRFDFEAPFGALGRLACRIFLQRYMRRFLMARTRVIKDTAESDRWRQYLRNDAADQAIGRIEREA